MDLWDGSVTINSLQYPVHPTENRLTDLKKISTFNTSEIPRNYMANLTYRCGSAREFFFEDDSQSETISMTCQWNKEWTPTYELARRV